MILIGQFDSPFVRRIGIALELYEMAYEHRPWSAFGDAGKIAALNPLTRVPTLVLDDGEVLVDSASMIDHLDSLVPAGRALFPRAGAARRHALRIAALATGLGDKAVSLFYEQRLHEKPSSVWVERCKGQIAGTMAALEASRSAAAGAWWMGEGIGHADIAVGAVLRFLAEAHAGLVDMSRYPALAVHAARFEALPVAQRISQRFIPPA